MADAVPGPTERVSLGELAVFFLRLGVTAFGGPAAHISMMESMLVRERRWLSRESSAWLVLGGALAALVTSAVG